MEIQEVKKRTENLKNTIQLMIETHEKETGMRITDITISRYGSFTVRGQAEIEGFELKIRQELIS